LLLPIEWNEPFGLIIIEAMLSGCPVVAFARGSVPELVEHGVTGFIARDVDDMASLIRPGGPIDNFDRRRCRDRAVQRFSRDRMVADHVALYERVRRSAPLSLHRHDRASPIPA
jgi:glycosyltransferase involved in cell wall biosynthesis